MSTFEAPAERDQSDGSFGVADPDDYLLMRRLRQIMDARERFAETVRERKDDVVSDDRQTGITFRRYRELVADAAIEYLVEVEPLLRHDDLEEEQSIWAESIDTDPQGGAITCKRIVESGGTVPDESGEPVPLPVSVSRGAYRAVNRFLSTVGFGVRLDSGLPTDDGFDATADRGRSRTSDVQEVEA